jgi:hypothetical protein
MLASLVYFFLKPRQLPKPSNDPGGYGHPTLASVTAMAKAGNGENDARKIM